MVGVKNTVFVVSSLNVNSEQINKSLKKSYLQKERIGWGGIKSKHSRLITKFHFGMRSMKLGFMGQPQLGRPKS